MDANVVARRFGLGRVVRLSDGPVARGKQGLVWRLETADGSWAVKTAFRPSTENELSAPAQFQDAAFAAGVPTPQIRRTAEGRVLATIDGTQVRAYQWVDLLPADAGLDPVLVGATVAGIHRVQVSDLGPTHPWYYRPSRLHRLDQRSPRRPPHPRPARLHHRACHGSGRELAW